jgi:hypothetical protein
VFLISSVFGGSISGSGGGRTIDKCPNCRSKDINYFDDGDDGYQIIQGFSRWCSKCNSKW